MLLGEAQEGAENVKVEMKRICPELTLER